MKRKELLKSKEYWLVKIQNELHNELKKYMKESGLNQSQLAEKLKVTKGYVSQILNGDFDYRLSKFIDLCLSINKVPEVKFKNLKTIIEIDSKSDIGTIHNQNDPVNIILYGIKESPKIRKEDLGERVYCESINILQNEYASLD